LLTYLIVSLFCWG